MEKKITKRMVLEHLIEKYANDSMVVDYATNEIRILDNKKASNVKTKTQIENESIKKVILNVLVETAKAMTITEIQEKDSELATLSNQKMSALLKQLVDSNEVEKTIDKKKAYFEVKNV
jgi:hypothetical protein